MGFIWPSLAEYVRLLDDYLIDSVTNSISIIHTAIQIELRILQTMSREPGSG